jgi:hypothetical protein
MALHKAWLAEKVGRRLDKRPKDAAQAKRLFALVLEYMPHYPMDETFVQSLPTALRPVFIKLQHDYHA